MSAQYVCGLDLGAMADHSALCVLERTEKHAPGIRFREVEKPEIHYAVRLLRRWPLATAYPDVVKDVAALIERPPLPGCRLAIDAGGPGRPVVDLFKAAVARGMKCNLTPVTITGGNVAHLRPGGWNVPKSELVSVMQSVFQGGRLKVAQLPERDQLLRELRSFQLRVSKAGHTSFEAATEAIHDDMVMSLSLGLWLSERDVRPAGGLRVIRLRGKGTNPLSEKELKGSLHVVICTKEQLKEVLVEDHSTKLIVVDDPPKPGETLDDTEPAHGLAQNVATLRLSFADLQPEGRGDSWEEPVEPWGVPVRQLLMDQVAGKRLWRFIRNQRDRVPEVLVVAAQTMGVAESIAKAICDQLRCDRQKTLYRMGGSPDELFEGPAPNQHVYQTTSETRVMVV
jgi:hypothetical protein